MSKNDARMDTIVAHFFTPGDAGAMKRFCAFVDALEEGMRADSGLKSFVGAAVMGSVVRLLRDQVIPSMERQGL